MFDVHFARSHFPALERGWALFDNAAGSVTPRPVIERVSDYMARYQVQPGGTYAQSVEATERIHAGVVAAAELLGAAPDEVVIGASTTMNVYVLAHALAPSLSPGDEIIVTNLDHEANIGAWRRLEALGMVIKEWRFHPDTLALELDDLDALLTERTRLVCFTHCSNLVGAIHDVAAAARRVHDAGALVCVDGVAYAPHRAVNVKTLDVDFYLTSLYKTFGPHLGLLYAKRTHLAAVANQNHGFLEGGDAALKLEPGYINHELTASLPGILAYFDALDRHHHGAEAGPARRLERVFSIIAAHEERLVTPLIDYLAAKPGIRLLGPARGEAWVRAPIVSFAASRMNANTIPVQLERARIAARAGDFYARRAVDALGLSARGGVVRVSMAHYNTEDEVRHLIEALDRIL